MEITKNKYESIGVVVTSRPNKYHSTEAESTKGKTTEPSFLDKSNHTRFVDNLFFAKESS